MAGPPVIPRGNFEMTSKLLALAGVALVATGIGTAADARSMRAVGSSTGYPFAKIVAERIERMRENRIGIAERPTSAHVQFSGLHCRRHALPCT